MYAAVGSLLEHAGFRVDLARGADCPDSIRPVTGPADYDSPDIFLCWKGLYQKVQPLLLSRFMIAHAAAVQKTTRERAFAHMALFVARVFDAALARGERWGASAPAC